MSRKEWPATTLHFPFHPCGLGIYDIKNMILDLGSGLLKDFRSQLFQCIPGAV